jgi:hypothetical protein
VSTPKLRVKRVDSPALKREARTRSEPAKVPPGANVPDR